MNTIDLSGFELDEFGRARLSDEDLKLLDDLGRVSLSGGDGINDTCTGSNNLCRNEIKCDGSTNGECANARSCHTTRNTKYCGNTSDEQIEIDP